MKNEFILLDSLKQNNLKSISLKIPIKKITVIRGVSGSGKSSLAIETLFKESQRRFFLSLSTFARQFFEKYQKPDYKSIENLPPAISIEKKSLIKNPRSIVATITDLYDFLKILFEKYSTLYCPKCNHPVKEWTPFELKNKILKNHQHETVTIGFLGKKSKEYYFKKGFQKILENNEKKHILSSTITPIHVIVDTIKVDPLNEDEIFESLELSFKNSDDIFIYLNKEKKFSYYSSSYKCPVCGIHYEKPDPSLFSFNSPKGACEKCKGFGDIIEIDLKKIIPDSTLSIEEGAIEPFMKPKAKELYYELIEFAQKSGIPTNIPFNRLSNEHKKLIIEGNSEYYGIKGFFSWLEKKKYKLHVRVYLSKYRKYTKCPSCNGTRLNKLARSYYLEGKNMGEILLMNIREFSEWLNSVSESIPDTNAQVIIKELKERIDYLKKVKLDYLTLSRKTFTLSGGEAQRISLSSVLGSGLSETLIILDEPTAGLHKKDSKMIAEAILKLKENGNTVVVVDNSDEILGISDFVVELGPKGGEEGGYLIFSGNIKDYKPEKLELPHRNTRKKTNEFIKIKGAKKFNLKSIDFNIPLKAITIVKGVSGAGKSTLIKEVLYKGLIQEEKNFDSIFIPSTIGQTIFCDSSPLTKTPRATPITYLKLFKPIREFYAKLEESLKKGYKASHFSFLSKLGACRTCNGNGFIKVEMQFLSDLFILCDECGGKRYKEEILEVKYKEASIYDILWMSFEKIVEFFSDEIPLLKEKISIIKKVGLGYIKAGQPLQSLSGGEAQRIKLLYNLLWEDLKNSIIILDEPSSGLHPKDEIKVVTFLRELVESKNATIVIAEHSPIFENASDYIIELGPEGGDKGGYLIKEGFL